MGDGLRSVNLRSNLFQFSDDRAIEAFNDKDWLDWD